MSVERISQATVYDADQLIIQTDEVGLLVDSQIHGSILRDGNGEFDEVVRRVIGRKNHSHYLDMSRPGSDEDGQTVEEKLDELRIDYDWYRHLLGRELAVRSIEMSVLTGTKLSPDIGDQMMEQTRGTKYDRIGRIRINKPDINFMKKWVSKDIETDGLSLGDFIARERVYREQNMLTGLGLTIADIAKTQPHFRLAKKLDYKQSRQDKEQSVFADALDNQQGLAQIERLFIGDLLRMQDIREGMLSDEMIESLDVVKQMAGFMKKMRSKGTAYVLHTASETSYHYFPSNLKLYKDIEPVSHTTKEERPSIMVSSRTEEEEAEYARKVGEQKAAAEARRAEESHNEQKHRTAINEHNMPIFEEMNRLADEYNGTIAEFVGQTSRSLREKGLLGKDSLGYALSQCKRIEPEVVDRTVRVYARLHELAGVGKESLEILTEQLLHLEQLQSEYERFLQEHPLLGGVKPPHLDAPVKPELTWLTRHFDELQSIIGVSRHAAYYTPSHYRNMAAMLGIQVDEESAKDEVSQEVAQQLEELVDVEQSIEEPEVINRESPLIQANRLAEQLNWVVLPDEDITSDELVDIAEKTTRTRSNDRKPAVVEKYRMEALLELRKEYGGTLYRSDERTLGDGENLYFVLRFQHPGDDHFYAVAENPVYGNATYVLREDTLPLQPGESVLAAVQLSRKDVRYFGAERIVHGTPDLEVHYEKVSDRIVKLSERESVLV